MNAILDLRNGDYKVWLTAADIEKLYNCEIIMGELIFRKNGTREIHTISISFKPKEEIRAMKTSLRTEHKIFYEGPNVMIVRQQGRKHHDVHYVKDTITDLREKFVDTLQWQENRYDGFTGNKIFLYPE
jgi:hypothetical protein